MAHNWSAPFLNSLTAFFNPTKIWKHSGCLFLPVNTQREEKIHVWWFEFLQPIFLSTLSSKIHISVKRSCFSEAVMSHVPQYNNLAHKHVQHKPQCKIDSQRLHRKYWFHINGFNSEWKWGVRTKIFKTRSASTRPLSLKHFFEGKVYFVSIWNLMKLFRRG